MSLTLSVIRDLHEPRWRIDRDLAHVSTAGTFALCGRVGDGNMERVADAFVATELVVDDVFSLAGHGPVPFSRWIR